MNEKRQQQQKKHWRKNKPHRDLRYFNCGDSCDAINVKIEFSHKHEAFLLFVANTEQKITN